MVHILVALFEMESPKEKEGSSPRREFTMREESQWAKPMGRVK